MRKLIVFALLATIGCSFVACSTPPTATQSNLSENAASIQITAEDTASTSGTLPVYTPGLVELNPGEDYCVEDGVYFKRSYRLIYYRIPSPIDDLAGEEGYAFLDETSAQAGSEELPEMLLVSYVKKFNISKEIFENALIEIKNNYHNAGVDTKNEEYEIPNADIIYTFDNDIINEYYRRK